ncbi:ATP-binding domain-containing protein [Nitrospira sp. Kam-Ns4a]
MYFYSILDNTRTVATPLGVTALNAWCQQRLNPLGTPVGDGRLRLGDRVIVQQNLHVDAATFVANGHTGVLIGSPDPTLGTVRLDHGPLVALPLTALDLAYCLTIHRAQGSQWDTVILVWPAGRRHTELTPKLHRVGCTRATVCTYQLVWGPQTGRDRATPDASRRITPRLSNPQPTPLPPS